ncbi:MAG: ParB/RepB/Spo0J family partition protein [Burkholderiaceae bacterium]|nr:ParB/RepB/Spo0J family partition protein [Burkholderiaceae bacterium]
MKINKANMAARAAQAANMAPKLTDRFAHARELSHANPVSSLPVPVPAVAAPMPPVPEPTAPVTSAGGDHAGVPWVTQLVPQDQIDPNPFNARKVYRPERVTELAASIGAHGQETPGLATIRNGRYILVAGHYRQRALRTLGNKPMLLTIRPDLADRELYEMSYRENAEREEQSALDNALAWKELLAQGIYQNETEIAEATGISLPSVNRTLAILKLSDTTMGLVKDFPTQFGVSVLYELVQLEQCQDGVEQALICAQGVVSGEVSRRDIEAIRKRLAAPNVPRKRKETARTYKIQKEGKEIGSLKTWDSGKISLEVSLADPRERTALISELQQRFGLSE